MRERRTYGSVRGLRREPLVYSTIGNLNSAAKRNLRYENDKRIFYANRKNWIFTMARGRFDFGRNAVGKSTGYTIYLCQWKVQCTGYKKSLE